MARFIISVYIWIWLPAYDAHASLFEHDTLLLLQAKFHKMKMALLGVGIS